MAWRARGRVTALRVPSPALVVVLALVLVLAVVPGGAAVSAGARAPAGGDDVSADEAQLLAQIEDASARRRALDQRVSRLDDLIAGVRADLRVAESRLSALFARQRGAEVRLEDTRRQLAEAKQALQHQALAAYTGQGDGRLAGILLRVQDVGELAAKRSYLRVVADTQAEAISAHRALQDRTQDLVAELSAARATAQAERDVVEQRRARIQAERDTQDELRHEIDRENARRNRLIEEGRARRAQLEAPVVALQQQSAAVEGTLRDRQQAPAAASVSGGRLASPIPGAPVTSGFGARVHPIYGDVRVHTGVDLRAATGVPIRAAADGVVLSAGWLGGYGNATIVDHGGPMATLYAHQSQILVAVGARVARGQVIGRVGCTGSCTGPHLHYEVRLGGKPVNPAPYL